MWTKSKSLLLSYVIVWVVLALLVAAVFLIPQFASWYEQFMPVPVRSMRMSLSVTLYASLAPAFAAMLRLRGLLANIRQNQVFVQQNTRHLRVLSYCCWAESAVFFGFGFVRPTSFVLSFAAFFFGLILRVLKNVFEKAVELREENDAVI